MRNCRGVGISSSSSAVWVVLTRPENSFSFRRAVVGRIFYSPFFNLIKIAEVIRRGVDADRQFALPTMSPVTSDFPWFRGNKLHVVTEVIPYSFRLLEGSDLRLFLFRCKYQSIFP
jgi:hypothetical protein